MARGQLRDKFKPGRPRFPWVLQFPLTVLAVGLAVIGASTSEREESLSEGWLWLGAAVLLAAIAGVSPNLEIVQRGRKTRWERFGRPVALGVVTIALGVAGTAIYDVMR